MKIKVKKNPERTESPKQTDEKRRKHPTSLMEWNEFQPLLKERNDIFVEEH